MKDELEKDLERTGRGLIEVLSRRLTDGIEENQEKPQLRPVFRPRFEASISRTKVQSVTSISVSSVYVSLGCVCVFVYTHNHEIFFGFSKFSAILP
jgi:hypothetical protein